jgi:hypothetical protein
MVLSCKALKTGASTANISLIRPGSTIELLSIMGSSNHNGLSIEGVVESSQPSTPPADICKALPFTCSICNKRYKQRQGLNRHYGEKHNPNLCMYSYCNFGWTRPCKYRAHLRKHHPNVNPDEVLGKTAESRCRTSAFARRRSQHDSEPQQGPLTPSPPAVAKIMYLPPAFSFTGEDTQPVNNAVNHAFRLPQAYPSEPTAADYPSHAAATAFISPLPPHVGEYYGTPLDSYTSIRSLDSYDRI